MNTEHLESQINAFLASSGKGKRRLERGKKLLQELRSSGQQLDNPAMRRHMTQLARNIADALWEIEGKYHQFHLDFYAGEEIFATETPGAVLLNPPVPNTAGVVPTLPTCPAPRASTLFGRQAFIESIVAELIGPPTIVAVFGLPGVGKSDVLRTVGRLTSIISNFVDGVLYVELGQYPEQAMGTLRDWLKAYGEQLPEDSTIQSLVFRLTAQLRFRRSLLIIDDIWQSSLETAMQLRDAAGEKCAVLTSTRSPEIARSISRGRPGWLLDILGEDDALAILNFQAPIQVEREPEAAKKLVNQLGRLPLAVTLAAGHVYNDRRNEYPCAFLATHWAERLDALRGYEPRPDLEELELSLKTIIGLSIDSLEREIQQAAKMLGAFGLTQRGWSWEAMQAVWAVDSQTAERWEKQLIANNLIQFDQTQHRYQTHATIAAYLAPLTLEVARQRHAAYFLVIAEDAATKYVANAQTEAFQIWEEFYPQIQVALNSVFSVDDIKQSARFCVALWRFWEGSGRRVEGDMFLERLIQSQKQEDDMPRIWTEILHASGAIAFQLGRTAVAQERLSQALLLRKKWNDSNYNIARTLSNLGAVSQDMGNNEAARRAYEDAIAVAKNIDDEQLIVTIQTNLALLEYQDDHLDETIELLEKSIRVFHASNDQHSVATFLSPLAIAYYGKGNLPKATKTLYEAIAIAREVQLPDAEGQALNYLGWINIVERDTSTGRKHITDSLKIYSDHGDDVGIATCLEDLAMACIIDEELERAARLLGVVDAIQEPYNTGRAPFAQKFYEEQRERLHSSLPLAILQQETEVGRRLTRAEVMDEALRG